MKKSMILARDIVGVIGVDNKLPWNVPADMAIFKAVTKGKTIIMGRKTWDSLPIKPLPGRVNIIISSESNFRKVVDVDTLMNSSEVILTNTIENALAIAERYGDEEVVFIGGKSIYEQVAGIVDEIHVSELNMFVPESVIKSPNVDIYPQDFEDIGFVKISHEEVFDDGACVLDYIRYARPQ